MTIINSVQNRTCFKVQQSVYGHGPEAYIYTILFQPYDTNAFVIAWIWSLNALILGPSCTIWVLVPVKQREWKWLTIRRDVTDRGCIIWPASEQVVPRNNETLSLCCLSVVPASALGQRLVSAGSDSCRPAIHWRSHCYTIWFELPRLVLIQYMMILRRCFTQRIVLFYPLDWPASDWSRFQSRPMRCLEFRSTDGGSATTGPQYPEVFSIL